MRSNKLTLQVGLLLIFRHDRIFDHLHTAIANGHKIKFRGQKERKKLFNSVSMSFSFSFRYANITGSVLQVDHLV